MRRVLDPAIDAPFETARNASDFVGFQRDLEVFSTIERARDSGFAAIDAWICHAPGASFYREYEAARRRLVLEAASSKARGIALRLARQVGGASAETWVAHQLDEEPGPHGEQPDEALLRILEAILERARQAGTAELPPMGMRIALIMPPAYCAAAPLRIR
jgi:hypothetical protein